MTERGTASNRNGLTAGKRVNTNRGLALVLLSSTVLGYGLLVAPPKSYAQSQQAGQAIRFSIPAQPLSSAIDAFSRATGWQVGYSSDIARSTTSRAVSGAMTPAQALQTMVAGTGVSVSVTGPTSAALVGANAGASGTVAADGSLMLETITVQGEAINNWNVPPEYAGGQIARGGQVGMLGNRDVMNTPFSQTNYTRKTIENQQAQTVQDVLSNDPSIVTPGTATTAFDSLYIRGFRDTGGTRQLNGLPGMAPIEFPSTDYIERVEVLKGPSALLNGALGAVGGTVNLVTKKAGDEPITQLTTTYVSKSQVGAHVDFGRRFGANREFGIRFNGTLAGGEKSFDHQDSKIGNAALNLDYRGDRVRLSADIIHDTSYYSPEVNQLAVGNLINTLTSIPRAPSASTSLAPPWQNNKYTTTLGMLRGEIDIAENITAYGAVGASKFKKVTNAGGNAQLLDPSGLYGWTPVNSIIAADILSWEGGVRATGNTGPVDHTLNLNVSQNRTTSFFSYTMGSSLNFGSIYNPIFPSDPLIATPGRALKTGETLVSSFGIADTFSFFDERVQLTAGIRYQQVDTTNFANTGAVTTEYKGTAWSPAVGLVVKPWENVSLYANYIEGLQSGTTVGINYSNAGQTLAPYVSKQYETGVKVDWGTVITTLALFEITQPSAISVANGTGLPTLAVDGEQRNRGIELSAYGELFDRVRLLGGITLLDARRTKTANGAFDGAQASGVPRFRTVIGGEWDTPFIDGLTLTGRLTYTGEQVADNTRPDLKLPSWTQVDLGARYAFSSPWNEKPITVRFSVDNVFDKGYWKGSDGGDLFRGEPRTFRLSTAFNF